MGKPFLMITLLFAVTMGFSQSFFEKSDQFFHHFVEDGLVKYSQIKKNPSQINQLVSQIGEYKLQDVSNAEKKAFYINAYNLLVIKHIVDNLPTNSPLTIDGFFDKIKSKVAGEDLTLDQLEKEKLYQSFPDPRIHFVLVCAAMGCPPLAEASYKPEDLEVQLEKRVSFVLNFQPFIRVNNVSIQVSKIFEWYEKDFVEESGSVIKYIDHYHERNLIGKNLTYYEYDWSLNKYER